MNPKIFVVVAVVVLAGVLGLVLFSSSTLLGDSQQSNSTTSSLPAQLDPIIVKLEDVSILEVNERAATIGVEFVLENPNTTSVLVQVMDYQLYETGFSESVQVSGGQMGNRPEGMVEFGNNYFVLLGENSLVLKDKVVLSNTGSMPELWSAIWSDTAKWKITGDVFYNLSSMTSGQESIVHFEFTS